MKGSNFKQNNEYFRSLAIPVVGGDAEIKERVHLVTPTQLKVGELAKFTYAKTGRDYTAVVAATAHAPFGRYTAQNTRNVLITMFLLDRYSAATQASFLSSLYASKFTKKKNMVTYKPQDHVELTATKTSTGFIKFVSTTMEKINLRVKSNTELDSRNFRTFVAIQMQHCKVLK